MKRKIIQIAPIVVATPTGAMTLPYVLCDDGTLWVINPDTNQWDLMVNVPQNEVTQGGYQ